MTAAKKPRGLRAPARRQVVGHKGGEKQQKKPVVASNDTGSIATAQLLYIWSWGPIVGPVNGLKSIKLAGTPLVAEDGTVNYPGVKWQFRSGELNQERLTGITEASNEIQVGQELRTKAPYLRSINNAMLDAVRVRLSWPQLTHQDSTGNISGVRIEYAIDVATDGGPYQTLVASEVNRKNITKYERDHRIELPAGSRWTVRVRRITPEAGSEFIQDGMYVEAIAELVDSDQEYPLTAVGSIEYDAQQFGGDIAKIAVLMRGRIVKVPANYNAVTRTYATSGPGTSGGIWDGTFKEAYTNNPAWVLYDLVLHPYYGLGERINASMVNRWSLYRIGQFCDQLVPDGMGGQEPRFTCNLYLQKQADAWAVIQDLASIFHGLAFWDGSQIVVNADMPQDSAYTYTMAQIIGGNAVSYQGSKWRDRHSQAIVSFDDPAQGFDTDKEPVFDEDAIAEFGVRELSVEAPGCTSRGQAQRAGHWALMTEQLQTRGTTIRVGLDGYIPKPGKVISLADPMLAGRANGGRIAAVAGRVVTLDRDIVVPSGARLLVNLPSGKSEARQVRSVAGRKVTVMADYSEVPQAECGWALDYDDLKLMQFYVRNVTRPEWHQFQLELIQHEPSKFSAIDYGTMIDDRPISVLPPGVQAAPARVLITSHSAIDQGIAVTTMTIGWDAAPGAVAYEVEWRWGSREWVRMPATGELATDVRGVYAGQYLARVRAISAMDVASIPTTSMLTQIAGKTTPPPAVTHLTAESLIFGIGLKWGFPAGAQDTQRTELWYSAGSVLADATKLADLAYPQDKHTLQGLRAGQRFFFWARLVDRSGNVGPWFPSGTTLVTGQASADAGPILEQIKDQITESELGKQLTSKIEKIALIDGNGPGSVNERVGSAKTELAKQISDVNNALSTTKTNLQQQITAVSADVTAAKTDLQQQIANVSALAGSLPYRKDKAYSVNQSALGSDGKLYQALKAVPLNTPPPNTTYWTDVGQAIVTAAGTAARVQTVETKVETLEGSSSAQASQITGLQTSLTTTNGNVAAAQTAADAANTLAGGKGKVIIQAAAPGVADRLAQNLWIDTTGNANTPKRWTGSAWAAVTDKAATDAAVAAAGALALAQTKADASVVSSISTRVTDAEGKLTSQATRLDGMQTSIDGKASSQALQQVTSRVTATEQKDSAQDLQLTSQSQALTSLKDSVDKKAEASTVQSLSNTVAQQGQSLTAQGTSLTKIEASLPSISGENLLANSSFEELIADGSRPRHWVVSGAAARAAVPSPLTSSINALRISATIAAGGYIEVVSSPVDGRARVKVTGGATYTLSVYARGSGAPGFLRLYLQFLDAAGGVLSAPSTADKLVLGDTFTRYTLTGTAPASATQVNVYACRLFNDSNAAASIWAEVDNVQLQEGMVATAYQPSILAAADTSAEAVTSLGARVEKNEQGLKSSGEQVTRLNNSLAITDGNVDKAQKAAQAANDLADGKGKVLVQSGAPAAADRLTQNLWIDTTGGANTPKRWNGSAWLAVTDKLATDAAAAAQSALNQLGGKADASALASLGSAVEQQGRDITAAGQSITRIDTSIASSGSENLLFNPSFDVASATNANIAAGWYWRPSAGVVVAPTLRNSDLGAEGKCQRLDVTGLTADSGATYVDFVPVAERRPPAFEGKAYTASVYARGNTGLLLQIYLQFKDAAGNTLSTNGPGNLALNPTYQRPLLVSALAPAGSVRVDVLYRMRSNGGSSLTAGFVDFDMAQLEQGTTLTGWRDNGKANADSIAVNAAATTALNGRVERTEQGLTSTSGSLTQLENSIGDVGGENLLYNPSFGKYASLNGSAEGWEPEGPASTVDTLVTSWMNSAEKAQRIVAQGLNASSAYKSLRTTGAKRIAVAGGQAVTASAYVRRGSDPVSMRIFIQWMTASDSVISAPASALTPLTVAGERLQYTAVAPADAVKAYIYYRAYGPTASATPATFEVARPQAEYGTKATGWRDNGQVASNAIGAVSTAVDGLTSSVSQQGDNLSSVSGRTTTLENGLTITNGNVTSAQQAAQAAATAAGAKGEVIYGSVAPAAEKRLAQNLWIDTTGNANTPKRWNGSAWAAVTDKAATDAAAAAASALSQVATKAEASALQAVANRVTVQEGVTTSQSSSITSLEAKIGAAQAFVAGQTWEFTGSTQGWGANTSGATLTAGPLFATVAKYTTIQATNNFAKINGAENPLLRIRLRRRNTSRSTASMYWANEDGGLAESRRLSWPINTATTDWQDIEFDLSGHAGWTGKNISAIRLDMYNTGDANGEVDIAYIAAGRRSVAASGRAFDSLSVNVTQQGDKLAAETQRINGLLTSVGNASAAIQDEAKTRTDADSALSERITTAQAKANDAAAAVQSEITARANADTAFGRRVDGMQSSLGSTNAAVERTSTALTALNNTASASEVVRVQITASGIRHIGGFGIGIQNTDGVVQSTFAILADRFAILSPSGNSVSSPFAIQNGQTFISDAFIRDASITNAKITDAAITNAKIADASITTAKIGQAEVDTLRIRGNAVTVPVGAFAGSSTVSITVTLDGNYPVYLQGSITQTYLSNITMTRNGVLLWREIPRESTLASRGVMDYPGAGTHTYTLSSDNGNNTNGASIFALVCKR